MNLEQIALRVAEEMPEEYEAETCAGTLLEFARRLVAALGAQEPVIWIAGSYRKYLDGTVTDHLPMGVAASLVNWNWKDQIPLYAAPPICPACTQMIDEAAREGRIVDDRIPDGWQLVPKEPTDLMTWRGQQLRPNTANSIGAIYREMLTAAPEYKP